MMETAEDPLGFLFLTEQMSAKKGLKKFGPPGAKAIVKEMGQLDYREVIEPVHYHELTYEQRVATSCS